VNLKEIGGEKMSKNIFKIILLFILLFCLSNSAFFAYANAISTKKIENTAIDLTYNDMEAQFANNVNRKD
jgi:hypothetical protein